MLLESLTVVVSGGVVGIGGGSGHVHATGATMNGGGAMSSGPVAIDNNHNSLPIASLIRRLPESEPELQGEKIPKKTTRRAQSQGESEGEDEQAEESEFLPLTQQQEQSSTTERVTTTTVTTTPAANNNTTTMADKRRYYDRPNNTDNNNHSSYGHNSDSASRHSMGSGSGKGSGHGGPGGPDYDDPPNSRLFILCGRNVGEDELRESFGKFGEIKELWIVKDKASGESKGVAYITYCKTSEAAVAMEEMNGKFIGNNAKSLKVLIANSRDQGSRREMNEEERLLRLFIIVPKAMTELELKDHFAQFGDVERCSIVRERRTKESKGYAYVTFHRISHAAKAYEGCDRSFKPKFADPRPHKQPGDERYSTSAQGSTSGPYDMHEYNLVDAYPPVMNHHHHEQHAHMSIQHSSPVHVATPATSSLLTVVAHGSLNQDQLWRLCDFFPGLDYCNVRHDSKSRQVFASVVYNSPQAAAYAKEKLHGFEYPPGNRLIVKFESHPVERSAASLLGPPVSRYNVTHNGGVQSGSMVGQGGRTPPLSDLARISETFAQAQSLLQAQAHQVHMSSYQSGAPSTLGESYDPSYCSVKLPAPQPLAPMDSIVLERLFVVCHPSPPQLYALKDVFGRFGNLIDIFMLNGKNFGYAKYANKASADDAKSVLHGQEVCGMRLKVFHAEPQDQKGGGSTGSTASSHSSSDPKCKRLRMDVKPDELDL